MEYPGAFTTMSRADRREDIFLDEVDRQDFLKTLAESCQTTDWQVHAFCGDTPDGCTWRGLEDGLEGAGSAALFLPACWHVYADHQGT